MSEDQNNTEEQAPSARPSNPKRKLHFWIMGAIIVIALVGFIIQFSLKNETQESTANATPEHKTDAKPEAPSVQPLKNLLQRQKQAAERQQQHKAEQAAKRQRAQAAEQRRNHRAQPAVGGWNGAYGGTTAGTPQPAFGAGGNDRPAQVKANIATSPIIADSDDAGKGIGTPSPQDSLQAQMNALNQSLAQRRAISNAAQGDVRKQLLGALNGRKQARPETGDAGFLKKVSKMDTGEVLRVNPAPVNPTLMPGSVIPSVLVTKINSDLPGMIVARVTKNVYDSISGHTLMIPRGSTLVGYYNSNVAMGQTRVLLAFNKVIFPDGRSVDLQGMQAADAFGQSGLHDEVDSHFWKMYGASFLIAALSTLLHNSNQNVTIVNNRPARGIRSAAGQAMVDTSKQILQRYQNLAPTLLISQGFRFNVMVNHAVELPLGAS